MSGTFVAVKFHQDTRSALLNFAERHKVPNVIAEKDLHCTVTYSRSKLLGVRDRTSINPVWIGTPLHFEVFKSSEGKNCLVLRFTCGELYSRHHFLKHKKGATHDFPSFLPHITLSYDAGNYDISVLPSIETELPRILIVEEYSEDLKLHD
jgi:hypothetical protein